MGFLRRFLDKKADLYDLDLSQTTGSGQPIETLVLNKSSVPIFFSPHPSLVYRFVQAGGVKAGDFTAILENVIRTNQVLSIGGTKYRIVSAVQIKWGYKDLAYLAHLEYYHH